MRLPKLWLQFFRSYSSQVVEFSPTVTVVVGENAVGKTTLLEALMLLAVGGSFRAGVVDEMVMAGQELGRVKAMVLGKVDELDTVDDEGQSKEDGNTLEVMVTRGMVQGKRTQKLHYLLNNLKKRKKDFIGKFLAVCFRPEDMRLVEGSPGRRREFLDEVLVQVHPEYAVALSTYEQTLRRLNKLLLQVREGTAPVATLTFWNMQLVKHGEVLQKYRQEFFMFSHSVPFSLSLSATYLPSVISQERIKQYQPRAIAAGHVLVGPHKDDFAIELREWRGTSMGEATNIASFGSRGQQRLAVLWLKIVQLAYIESNTQEFPLLLLDDIWSELDHESQSYIAPLLQKHQTIITTTDPHLVTTNKKLFDGLDHEPTILTLPL